MAAVHLESPGTAAPQHQRSVQAMALPWQPTPSRLHSVISPPSPHCVILDLTSPHRLTW